MTIREDGTISVGLTTDRLTMTEGNRSLLDADGSALINDSRIMVVSRNPGSVATLLLLSGLLACGVGNPVQSAPVISAPLIELRVAYDTPGDQRERFEIDGRDVYLERAPILTDSDFTAVIPSASASGLVLALHYTPETGRRLAAVTADKVGSNIAVLIDSRIQTLAPIVSAIGKGAPLVVATYKTGAEAQELEERVREKWPIPQ